MQYILTSTSYLVTEKWIKHLNSSPEEFKVAFIDTAADVYDKKEADWLIADRDALTEVGFQVTDYSLVDKNIDQLKKELADFDLLFVAGGNSFYLLDKAIESGFLDLLKENFFADKIYVGSSAGSILVCGDISPIKFLDDPNKANKQYYQGAGIVDFLICPHWGGDYFVNRYEKMFDFLYQKKIAHLCLTDKDYLHVSNNSYQVILG